MVLVLDIIGLLVFSYKTTNYSMVLTHLMPNFPVWKSHIIHSNNLPPSANGQFFANHYTIIKHKMKNIFTTKKERKQMHES